MAHHDHGTVLNKLLPAVHVRSHKPLAHDNTPGTA